MKMKRTGLILISIFLLSGSVSAEQYAAGRVHGHAPLTVDGDFSDWDELSLIPREISQINRVSETERPRDGADLSASFRCLADDENLYIAVGVTDDTLVFGEEPPGRPFWDDCVEFLFYGPATGTSALKIWISRDKNGNVKIEGREPVTNMSYPFIWEQEGVAAALVTHSTGYRAEAMIPLSVLELTGWRYGDALRMNVAVYDDDEGGMFESVLQWADISDNAFNEVVFTEIAVPRPDTGFAEAMSGDVQEIEIVISSPEPPREEIDPEVQHDLAIAFERAGLHEEAIEELRTAERAAPKGELNRRIMLALARNHYFIGEYDQARRCCEDMLAGETDDKRTLDANMILLSIERKQSNSARR